MPGYNTLYKANQDSPPPHSSADYVLRGHQRIIDELRSRFPYSKMIIIGHTPYNNRKVDEIAKQINLELLEMVNNSSIYFINLTQHLVDRYGKRLSIMFKDGVHLTKDAYDVWHQVMRYLFERLLSD